MISRAELEGAIVKIRGEGENTWHVRGFLANGSVKISRSETGKILVRYIQPVQLIKAD